MIDWSFCFVYVLEGNPKVDLVCSFRDGNAHLLATKENFPEIISQMESVMQLLSYIAYFPNKDFTKIKLNTAGNQFAVHFLDKRWLKHNEGFLGILSVNEFDTDTPFETWGVEEIFANYIFEYFQDMKVDIHNAKTLQEFHNWISEEVSSFYKDWSEAKQLSLGEKKTPIILPTNGSELSEDPPLYEHWWEIQLINEYGAPLSEVISFIDGQAFLIPQEESENMARSLESMSISALKILIDQQAGWNINYIKNRLENEMGYSYVLFDKFSVRDIKYLIIMNSSWYSFKKDKCVQRFRGNEFALLLKLCEKLQTHTMFYTPQGQLKASNKQLIQKIILKCIDDEYK